jgi:hypothetical protein
MDVVQTQMAFYDLALPLLGQLVENPAQVSSDLAVEHFAATLRDEHDVILALPSCVV